jgi:ATP-dependent Zn protease
MAHAMEHCDRTWWKRPPVWFIGIVVVALLVAAGIEMEPAGKMVAMPYSTFLDQLDAGDVASVTLNGTEIRGRLKHPLDKSPSKDTAQSDAFRSRVPDFGDSALIGELRKQHVTIEVSAPSPWVSVLSRIPWPMLVFLGVILFAALVRLVRGGRGGRSEAAASMPMHGMVGLVSGLFAKRNQPPSPPTQDGDGPQNG